MDGRQFCSGRDIHYRVPKTPKGYRRLLDQPQSKKNIRVPDVSLFSGHIACDARSKSEIVVPVRNAQGHVIAVLDGDSDKLNTFDEIDAEKLSIIANLIYHHPATF